MSKKQAVWERAGRCCARCRRPLDLSEVNLDPVRPRDTSEANLRPLCRACFVLRLIPSREGLRADAIAEGVIPSVGWRELTWE